MTLQLKSLSDWQQDSAQRMNPNLLTRLLRKSVPVLEHCKWRVIHTAPGLAKTVLPLNGQTTNQHGTHQAALIALSADYTGGIAMSTLLSGVPIAGVHSGNTNQSASVWLAGFEIKFLRPSTGHLTGTCQIESRMAKRITSRYFSSKTVLCSLDVQFESNGDCVARATMKYFAQPATKLDSRKGQSSLFAQKLKASARMIAGVRAVTLSGQDGQKLRIDCPMAEAVAGPQGKLLAEKLRSVLPELPKLVSARTQHVDQMIRAVHGLRQIVLVGAGLDMRPYRHADNQLVSFEIDLPEMLEERERVLAGVDRPPGLQRETIAADFRVDSLDEKLLAHPSFDPTRPTAFIYEGCSMYFSEDVNRNVLRSISKLMQNDASMLWADFVHQNAVDGSRSTSSVGRFLRQMDELGEAFVFGVTSPAEFLKSCGLLPRASESANDFLQMMGRGGECKVSELYHFTISGGTHFGSST